MQEVMYMRDFSFNHEFSYKEDIHFPLLRLKIDFIQDKKIVFSVTTMRKFSLNPYHQFDEQREYQRYQNKIQDFINDFIEYGLDQVLKMNYSLQYFGYDNGIHQIRSTFYLSNVNLNCLLNLKYHKERYFIEIPYSQNQYMITIDTQQPFDLGDPNLPSIYQEINNKTSIQVLSEYKGCTYMTSQILGSKYIFKGKTCIYLSKEAYTKINTVDYLLERKVLSGNPIIDIDETELAMLLIFKHGEKIIITDVDNGKPILK